MEAGRLSAAPLPSEDRFPAGLGGICEGYHVFLSVGLRRMITGKRHCFKILMDPPDVRR